LTRNGMRDSRVLESKALKIKLVLVDCGGVLSDVNYYIDEAGQETSKFSVRDLIGIALLKERAKIGVVLINPDRTESFIRMAQKVNLDDSLIGAKKDVSLIDKLAAELNITPDQIAYIGDELEDIDMMKAVGLAVCPLDAVYEARATADYVCNSCGGNGVLREFVDYLFSVLKKEACVAGLSL
jgi:3-deoxy-D-manno-octulosonate 8-phosphate phosphatase (KDO 8-P phosphatase)